MKSERPGVLPRFYSDVPATVETTALTPGAGRRLNAIGAGRREAAHVVVIEGPNVGEMFVLEAETSTVGRDPSAAVCTHDPNTSRQHATIRRVGLDYVLEDLGSVNGTYVNEQRVSVHVLREGDKIAVGARTILRFSYHDRLDEHYQRKVRESIVNDEFYRALFVSGPLPTFVVDKATEFIVAANRAATAAYGYTEAEFIEMRFSDLAGPQAAHEETSSVIHRRKDGASMDVVLTTQDITLFNRPASLTVASDETERKHIETKLRVADRMASVGTLAAGVAHEINNPLAYVAANIQFASEKVSETFGKLASTVGASADACEQILAALNDAADGAERIRRIVRDLNCFSRMDDVKRELVDVHRTLDAAVNMAMNEIRHRARLTKAYAPERIVVEGNSGRFGQVFLNLLVNAAQAIPEGDADRNEICVATGVEADVAWIEVRDTGTGIPLPVQARLFDAFYTTKRSGTGLGLTICQNIVTHHRGRIEFSTELGKGTRFRVTFPRDAHALAKCTPSVAPPSRATRPPTCGARILVVDDDAQVASALSRALSSEYTVKVALSGADALALIQGGERFDLVICDLMMPAMTGYELYARLRACAPDQATRMVFATGGAFTPTAQNFLQEVPNEKLDKPFDLKRVRQLVRERISSMIERELAVSAGQ